MRTCTYTCEWRWRQQKQSIKFMFHWLYKTSFLKLINPKNTLMDPNQFVRLQITGVLLNCSRRGVHATKCFRLSFKGYTFYLFFFTKVHKSFENRITIRYDYHYCIFRRTHLICTYFVSGIFFAWLVENLS